MGAVEPFLSFQGEERVKSLLTALHEDTSIFFQLFLRREENEREVSSSPRMTGREKRIGLTATRILFSYRQLNNVLPVGPISQKGDRRAHQAPHHQVFSYEIPEGKVDSGIS